MRKTKTSREPWKTTAQFINEAREIHGKRYSYDNVSYVNSRTPVQIHCELHGYFFQAPSGHLSGKGCSKCARQRTETAQRRTKKQFIKEADMVHKGRYSYNHAIYINSGTSLTILCNAHGPFKQTPSNHLKGQGCPKCGKQKQAESRRKTTAQFINEATKIHGKRYVYDKVVYINNRTLVQIHCELHGYFFQDPEHHLRGHGCPTCARQRVADAQRSNTEQFLARAREIHGDRYSYKRAVYINNHEPLEILCKVHGIFKQSPANHLTGANCPECVRPFVDTKVFVRRSREVHGDRYDYSRSVYNGNLKKVKIVCPRHGTFYTTPAAHWSGVGCQTCRQEKDLEKRKESFLIKAHEFHKNRYGYELVEYVNRKTKVMIVCPVHGPFAQTPKVHIQGHGCMQCFLDLRQRGYYRDSNTKSLSF